MASPAAAAGLLLALALAPALAGCAGPRPPAPIDCPEPAEPGPVTATPTAFFLQEPAEAAKQVADVFGARITGVQRGPEASAGAGRWWQIWETEGRGYITLHWRDGTIESVRIQGSPLGDWSAGLALRALPAGVPLEVAVRDDESWTGAQATPIGPKMVAWAWVPSSLFEVDLQTAYHIEAEGEGGWLNGTEATERARLLAACEHDRWPLGVELREPAVVDGRLAHTVHVQQERCSSQDYLVDARTGALLRKEFAGWCG